MCVCGGVGWGFREPQRWLVSHRTVHLMILLLFFGGCLGRGGRRKTIKGRVCNDVLFKRHTEKKIPNDEEKSDHKRTAFDRWLESSV